jgi:hypothetical protein
MARDRQLADQAQDQQRMQMQAALAQQNQISNQQEMMFRAAIGQQQNQQDWQQRQALAKQQFDWQQQGNQQEQAQMLERQQKAGDMQWEMKSADEVEKDTDSSWNNLVLNRDQVSPADQVAFNKFASDLQAIKKQRGKLRPAQYAQLLGEFSQNIETSGIRDRMIRPKSPEERVAEGRVVEPVYHPETKEYLGNRVSIESRRNGSSTWQHKFEPYKPPTGNKEAVSVTVPTAAGFKTWLEKNRKTFDTEEGPASMTSLVKRYREEVEAAKKLEEQSPEQFASEIEAQEAKAMLQQQIAQRRAVAAEMSDEQLAYMKLNRDGSQRTDNVSVNRPPEVRPAAAPGEPSLKDKLDLFNDVTNVAAGHGPQAPAAALGKMVGKIDAASNKAQPVSLNDLHPEDKKLAEMNLPRPRSKADRDQLLKGTKYIAPDGTIWTKQ